LVVRIQRSRSLFAFILKAKIKMELFAFLCIKQKKLTLKKGDLMKKLVLIILCTSLLTTGCKLYNPEINGVSIEKIREAKEIIPVQSSRVHIVAAHGERMNNEFMTDPEMTEVFRFIATEYHPYNPTDNIWKLVCEDDECSISSIDMLVGIVFSIDLEEIEMDVCDAWDLITEEYDVDSFYNWALSQPLHPDVEHPFFAFQVDGGFFIVNTITSEIEFEPY
jgi:hypothetical protein